MNRSRLRSMFRRRVADAGRRPARRMTVSSVGDRSLLGEVSWEEQERFLREHGSRRTDRRGRQASLNPRHA